MISRCYNTKNKDYNNYGAIGVTVCNRWLCFEYFINDLPYIDGYNNWVSNPKSYHLDKDYKQRELSLNKIYSLETCKFILNHDNILLSDIDDNHYIGLEPISNNKFRVRPRINNIRYNIGTFYNKIAAANAYNNFILYHFNNAILINKVQYMNPSEVMQYNLNPKIMCTIINN